MKEPVAVLFSGGLDSAVLLAVAAADGPAQPIYVRVGLAWEAAELAMAERLFHAPAYSGRIRPLVTLGVDMRDVYPTSHWAIRGEAPGFDTPDEDVYIEGRNIALEFSLRVKVDIIVAGGTAEVRAAQSWVETGPSLSNYSECSGIRRHAAFGCWQGNGINLAMLSTARHENGPRPAQ